MDVGFAKLVLDYAVAACSLAAFVGMLFLSRIKANANAIHIEERRLHAIENRLAVLEKQMGSAPGWNEYNTTKDRLSTISREVGELSSSIQPMAASLQRIESYLLKVKPT